MPVLQNLADPDMLHAIWLTVMIALIAVPVNLVFGILLAWLVTRLTSWTPVTADATGHSVCRIAGGCRSGVFAVLRL